MLSKSDLQEWIIEALQKNGGEGSVTEVAKSIWANHEKDLRNSGDRFYTWQYDIRWIAQDLQKKGALKKAPKGSKSRWTLT